MRIVKRHRLSRATTHEELQDKSAQGLVPKVVRRSWSIAENAVGFVAGFIELTTRKPSLRRGHLRFTTQAASHHADDLLSERRCCNDRSVSAERLLKIIEMVAPLRVSIVFSTPVHGCLTGGLIREEHRGTGSGRNEAVAPFAGCSSTAINNCTTGILYGTR